MKHRIVFFINYKSRIIATLPVGVPLAGYGERRIRDWPLPKETKYTTVSAYVCCVCTVSQMWQNTIAAKSYQIEQHA